MPAPDILRAYAKLIPDAPERLLRMAESLPKAELMLAEETVNDTRQGRWMAFCLALTAMGISATFFVVSIWEPMLITAGVAFLGLPVALMVKSMIAGRGT